MNLKKLIAVAALAASACLTSTVVSAVPLAPAKDIVRSESANLTQQVHYRKYRHRHHRRHHGYYGYRPGIISVLAAVAVITAITAAVTTTKRSKWAKYPEGLRALRGPFSMRDEPIRQPQQNCGVT